MREHDSPFLARACHDAAQCAPGEALAVVLRHLREAAGAERAFLLEAARASRSHSHRGGFDAAQRKRSRRSARAWPRVRFAARRPLFFADIRRDPVWVDGASIRALALRTALAAPLPRGTELDRPSSSTVARPSRDRCRGGLRAGAGVRGPDRALAPRRTPRAADDGDSAGDPARPVSRLPQAARRHPARRPSAAVRVDRRGIGKRERARRAIASRDRPAKAKAVRRDQLRGDPRGVARARAVRRDARGLHRRRSGSPGALSPGRGRHGLSRRDRRHDARASGQAAPGAPGTRRPCRRRARGAADRRSRDRRDPSRSGSRSSPSSDSEPTSRFRLEVLLLRVPPLRERHRRHPVLTTHLIERLAARCGLSGRAASTTRPPYAWPPTRGPATFASSNRFSRARCCDRPSGVIRATTSSDSRSSEIAASRRRRRIGEAWKRR